MDGGGGCGTFPNLAMTDKHEKPPDWSEEEWEDCLRYRRALSMSLMMLDDIPRHQLFWYRLRSWFGRVFWGRKSKSL
jgi:hypothetical protein